MKKITNPIVVLMQCLAAWLVLGCSLVHAQVVQLNSSGGASANDGLRIYLDSSSKMQVTRWNGTASGQQLFDPDHTPLTNLMRLDNGIYLRANNTTYGAQHDVGTPDFLIPNNYNTRTISGPTPAAAANGVVQTANALYAITNGPQISVEYRYTRPYDFVTLNVTLTIPNGYSVSAANPVRYYHAIDTFLGGSDNGCGVSYLDSNGNRVVGTYPPPSGNTCPSSTGVPAGVTIVESFRERSGQRFARYCVAGFQDFWDMNSQWTNCAIQNPNGLTTGVSNTHQDTGVAIQYDFTAAGTYTFSYDLVIGSPAVPPYDHLELRYTAGGNLCPMNVTVLGCTSSTVPCPAGSELTANLAGTLTSSGGGGMTWTPSTGAFSIAAGSLTTSLPAQPLSPGGTITLGAMNLSSVPLNGVKCWNGSSATCTFTLPNVGCFASDLDACSNLTGSPARCAATGNRLYTKVVGQAMSFDLVALKGPPKVVDTSFNSGPGNPVSVDLVSSTATAINATTRCPTTAPTTVSGVAAQTITFTSGRPAAVTTYTVPAVQNTQALRNVWVRFNQGAGGTFCSNDRFAIRPAAFTSITSSNANADVTGVSATATPIVRAGASFSLTANTGTPGYDGTPGVSPTLIEWIAMPVRVGTLAGSFSTGASVLTGDGATGSAFTYDEVGYFRFQPQGVYDATFTTAYQDVFDSVCINTAPNDFSNTPNAAGKVGCKFGNTSASNYFGRFYPDHFDTTVTQACPTGSFTYSGQPFTVQVAARNVSGGTTMNYHGTVPTVFSKATSLSARDSGDTAANPGPGGFTAGSNIAAAAFANGVVTTGLPTYQFTATNTVPTVVRVRAIDADGVTSLRTAPATTVEGTTTVRSGRLLLSNAYGSELLPLAVPAKVQYWSANGWAVNTADSCTALTVPTAANSGLTNTLRNKTTASIPTPQTPKVDAGDSRLRLSAPGGGNAGLVDITGSILRGANTWLTLPAPSARACFGSCGPRSPVIYFRESY